MTITPAKKLFVAAAAVVGIAVAGAAPGAHAMSLSDLGVSVNSKVVSQETGTQTSHVGVNGQDNLKNLMLSAWTGNRNGDGRTDAGLTIVSTDNLKNVFGTTSFSHDDGMGTTNDGRFTVLTKDNLNKLLLQGNYYGTNPDGSVQDVNLGALFR